MIQKLKIIKKLFINNYQINKIPIIEIPTQIIALISSSSSSFILLFFFFSLQIIIIILFE